MEVEEPDSHFEWLSPDESTRLPFDRSQEAAVQLSMQYDLCFGGEALHHVEQIGAAALFVPLTQVLFGCKFVEMSLLLHTKKHAHTRTYARKDGH